MIYANEINGIIKEFSKLPFAWHGKENVTSYYQQRTDLHEVDGFLPLIYPTLQANEQYGNVKDSVLNMETKEYIMPVVSVPVVEISAEEQQQQAIEAETERYKQRIADGTEYYAKISAEFRLAKLSGAITNEAHKGIEVTLMPVRNEVLAGQWLTAQSNLTTIGSSVIGVELYDRLQLELSNYIAENYE